MRLKQDNIRFVKEHILDGKDNGWYVAMKSYHVSDGREYENWESVPPTVKKFCASHERKEFEKLQWMYRGEELCETITYIYQ